MNLNLPISASTLLLYYVFANVLLMIVFVAGWLLKYYCFKIKEPISAFSILTCSVLGLSGIITIYSIVITKGLTVNWVLLFLFIIYWFFYKKGYVSIRVKKTYTSSWGIYSVIICSINIPFFLFFMYRIIDFENGLFVPFSYDLDYYAKVSQFLGKGYENGLLEYNFFKYIAPSPYHYFELWTNVLLYKFTGLNAVISYMVSLPMFFNSLIFISLLAIIEKRKKITFVYILFAFIALLLADIIPFLSGITPLIKGSTYRLSYPKMLPIFLFLFTSLVLYIYKKKETAYFTLLSIPILNIIPLVAVWGTMGVILLFNTYKKRKIDWIYWFPLISVLVLYLIYVLQSPPRSTHWAELFHWDLLRLYITQPILYVIAYIHFVIVIFILNKIFLRKVLKTYSMIYFLLCFVTITMSIIMRPFNYDATQFVNGTIPIFVFVVIVSTFLITITFDTMLFKRYLLYFFCIISLAVSIIQYKMDLIPWRPVASDYNAKIVEKIPRQEEYHIGFYIGENIRLGSGGNYVSGVVDAITIPDILDYYHNNVIHYSINKGENEARWSTDHTPYRDYYNKRKAELPEISDDEIRLDFIRNNNIEYIRIYKSATPSKWFLSHLILIAEDKGSGECFYKIK
ncbi:hypothetical protein [Parabacteroides provencensis]|uniref:hypothetical protein n=1 Tax=Parabacteroides provencensis TaxID=1944636 RepID=UPI00117CF088|nr:hypothetical protein [Parabacteroides provencensis]